MQERFFGIIVSFGQVASTKMLDGFWHFWTLSLEEQFYILWPTLLYLTSPRMALKTALVLVLVSPLIRVLTYFTWVSARGQIGIMLHTNPDALMLGSIAALAVLDQRYVKILTLIDRNGVYLVWTSLLFLLIVNPYLSNFFRGGYILSAGITLQSLAITCVMLYLVRNPSTLFGRFFENPLMIHFGIVSYSIYLWQQLFLTNLNLTWTGLFPINIAISILVAELSYWFVEKPFLKLKRFLA